MVRMTDRPRLYNAILRDHLQRHRQMALVSGPRQVGKTTACRSVADAYLNWDNADDRRLLLSGPTKVAGKLQLERLRAQPTVAVLDELHKHAKWKALLKGFFDTYGDRVRLIVTGSSRLDVFRRGGDSLMGRYLLYRMHYGFLVRPWFLNQCYEAQIIRQHRHAAVAICNPHGVVGSRSSQTQHRLHPRRRSRLHGHRRVQPEDILRNAEH